MPKKFYYTIISVALFFMCMQGVFSQENRTIDSLLSKLKESDTEEKLETYIDIVQYLNRTSPQKSIKYVEEAITLARKTGNKKFEAHFIHLMGISYHSQSIYSKALECYEQSYKLRKEIKDKAGEGESLNRISLISNVRGEYEKALEYCLQSIAILEGENDKQALGRSYNHLGILYYILNDMQKALSASERALEFNKKVGDDLLLAVSHEHLGVIYIKKKEYDKALFHVKKSLELRAANNDKVGLSGSYENLAVIARRNNNFNEALNYYEKSLEIKKEINNQRGVASSISGIGNIYFDMGQFDKSLEMQFGALEIRKTLGDKRGMVASYNRISESYNGKGDYKNAFEYLKKSKSLGDSLLNEQKNKAIAEYQAAYKHEMQDKQILKLHQENTLQKYWQYFLITVLVILASASIVITKAYRSKGKMNDMLVNQNLLITEQKEELLKLNEQLREVIATKDKFFSIIAHDLKSPYQGLLGYSQILSTEYETLSENEKISFIKSIEELSQNSFKLLENLLEWSRLQTGKMVFDPENFNLLLELYPTLGLLKQTALNKQIEMNYTIDNSLFVYADKNMLSTIIRNLVSNAIKFTNAGGKISVSAENKKDFVIVSVADNGVGMPKSTVDTLFNLIKTVSTRGTANEEGTGLGLTLCKEMINLHGGEIWAESQVGNGTTFYFTLKMKS